MKKIGNKIKRIGIIRLFLLPLLSIGQEVSFEAFVNRNPVAVGERIQYTVKLSNAEGQITLPSFNDFRILYGPSRSQNMSYINGKMTRSTAVSYVLIPEKEGEFTIDPASVVVGSDKYETKALKVTVQANSNANSATANNSRQAKQQSAPSYQGDAPKANENIILRVIPSRNSAYIGEPIRLDYILYSRYSNIELASFDVPPINGFWIEELETGETGWSREGETINGQFYKKALLKSQIIFPQNKGKITSVATTAECLVNRSFFSAGSRFKVESNTLNFNIKEFPGTIPGDFSGLTGKLALSVDIDKKEVAANEPITLKIQYKGSGNLNFINDPEISFPSDFEVYDPKESNNYKITTSGFKGNKTFEYLIIPRYSGTYYLGNITLSYFDPNAKKFVKLSSDNIKISVAQGAGETEAGVSNGKQSVKTLNSDINYIITTPIASQSIAYLFNPASFTFYIFLALILIYGVITFLYRNKQVKERANVVGYKYKKASKEARKKLSKAKKFMNEGNKEAFYAEMSQSIYNYLADKLNIAAADLNRLTISESLNSKPQAKELSEKLFTAIDTCEMARFAPTESKDPKEVYENVSQLISDLERVL